MIPPAVTAVGVPAVARPPAPPVAAGRGPGSYPRLPGAPWVRSAWRALLAPSGPTRTAAGIPAGSVSRSCLRPPPTRSPRPVPGRAVPPAFLPPAPAAPSPTRGLALGLEPTVELEPEPAPVVVCLRPWAGSGLPRVARWLPAAVSVPRAVVRRPPGSVPGLVAFSLLPGPTARLPPALSRVPVGSVPRRVTGAATVLGGGVQPPPIEGSAETSEGQPGTSPEGGAAAGVPESGSPAGSRSGEV